METQISEMQPSRADRIAGGLVGLLVGDALGMPYEFHEREEIPPFDEIEFEPPNWFRPSHAGISPGTWSDDGAQALILLDTLLKQGKFDAEHFATGLIAWYDNGFMAVGGQVFDVGIQTGSSIQNLKRGVAPMLAGGINEYSNGNGSLMRVLPLALWHTGSDLELVADAFDQSAVTHRHLRSRLCCALYCLWARAILAGKDVQTAWDEAVQFLRETFGENTTERDELEMHIRPDDIHEPRGSGYVVDSLFSARWACGRKNYEEIVKTAVSLGKDTDTTACIAGGIAGLIHGIKAIPERWQKGLRGRSIYEPLLNQLLARHK